MPLEPASLPAGTLVAHYRILGELGGGGMGVVYRAEDTRLGRTVALKFLPAGMSDDEDAKKRFVREARAASALDHPNICTIHQIGETDDGRLFIAMACYEGETLKDRIERGPLPVDEALRVVHQVATGLGRAHARGIIHRDVKPANVFLTLDGVARPGGVKILDFGLAKSTEPAAGLTRTGMSMGTPSYMSPEQVQGEELDPRSDLWSLGVVFYEALAGRRPFEGRNLTAVIYGITTRDPDDLRGLRPDVSDELAAIVARLLRRSPDERYASCEELAGDLERVAGWGSGATATRTSPPGTVEVHEPTVLLARPASATTAAPAPRAGRRRRVLAAAALVAAAGIAAVVLRHRPPAAVQAPGAADARPSLAVLFFDNRTRDPDLDWLRTGLADMLVTSLSRSPDIRVLSTSRVYQVLEELGGADRDAFTLVGDVGRRAGVERILVGSVMRAGERYRIDVKIEQAAGGDVLFATHEEGDGEESLFGMIDRVAAGIRQELALARVAGSADEIGKVATSSVEAFRHYAEALGHYYQGDFQTAAEHLRAAVGIDPDFSAAWSKLSSAYHSLGEFSLSEDAFAKAWQGRERLPDVERHLLEAQRFGRLSKPLEAIAAYERVLEIDPGHFPARYALVFQLATIDRYADALRHEERLLRDGAEKPHAYGLLATIHAALGEFERAEALILDLARRGSGNGLEEDFLGELYRRWGRFPQAFEHYEKAQVLRPDDPWLFDSVCMTYAVSGDWRGALALADRFAAHGGFPVFADVCRLTPLELAGKTAEARAVYRRLIDDAPTEGVRAAAVSWAAELELDLGQNEVARDFAAQVREIEAERSVSGSKSLLIGALAELRLGHRAEADALAAQLERLAAECPGSKLERHLWTYRGDRALADGDAAAATAALEKAAALLPPHGRSTPDYEADHVGVWSALASAYRAAGDDDRAADVLRRVAATTDELTTSPILYVRSLYLLGRHHADRGERAEAGEHYRRFLAFWEEGDIARDWVAEASAGRSW